MCLCLLDGAVVVDKDKCLLVFRVAVALGACIPWAEIARRVILWKLALGRRFLLTLPGSFCAMRRDEEPCASQRIVPPMGDVVKNLVRHLDRVCEVSRLTYPEAQSRVEITTILRNCNTLDHGSKWAGCCLPCEQPCGGSEVDPTLPDLLHHCLDTLLFILTVGRIVAAEVYLCLTSIVVASVAKRMTWGKKKCPAK